jgi:tetratricopeptide (TPR) repeat protein
MPETPKINNPIISNDNILHNLNLQVSIIDSYHHNYHYQSSAQYLWLGELLLILDKKEEALIAYKKALFQDHLNEEAEFRLKNFIEMSSLRDFSQKNRGNLKTNLLDCFAMLENTDYLNKESCKLNIKYSNHPVYDTQFCQLIGCEITEITRQHDKAVSSYLSGDYQQAIKILEANENHSNSQFLIGKCLIALEKYEEAGIYLSESIKLSHIKHDEYHKLASNIHVQRGIEFMRQEELELAIMDFSKALDLYNNNHEALRQRAKAYRLKGNVRLAENDEML